jgi:hypothetical protein
MLLHEIIQVKNLAYSCHPHKKGHPQRSLSLLHTLPREATIFRTSQGAKEGLDLKQISFEENPPQLILTTSSHFN